MMQNSAKNENIKDIDNKNTPTPSAADATPSETTSGLTPDLTPDTAEAGGDGTPAPTTAAGMPAPRRLPRFAIVLYALAAVSLVIYIVARLSPTFADFFNRYIGAVVRGALAHLTAILPFSLGEALVIFLPIGAVFMVVLACRRYADSWRSVFIYLGSLISVVSLLFTTFIWGFGTGYFGSTIDKKLGLDRSDVSSEELYMTAAILAAHVNEEAKNVSFCVTDRSVMPYSYDELSRRLVSAYDSVCDKYDFIPRLTSRVKPVMLSEPWTFTHISGVYTYFTGEANINVNFPDYTIPYTAAHEMAHQRGIAREDEANFVAFLVCTASDDPYIRYSGYLEVYEYVASSLYSANKSYYSAVYSSLDKHVREEMTAYSRFFDKYRENPAATVSETVNNTYLQMQGTVGSRSYGLVVDLCVAYYRRGE